MTGVQTCALPISVLFRKIYDAMFDHLKPNSIPEMIVTIGEWQFRSAFSADMEITLMSCITNLMASVEFK